MGKFRLKIDKNVCQGFGAGVELCPEFFWLLDVDGESVIEEAVQVLKEYKFVAEMLGSDELEFFRGAAESDPFNATQTVNLKTVKKIIWVCGEVA